MLMGKTPQRGGNDATEDSGENYHPKCLSRWTSSTQGQGLLDQGQLRLWNSRERTALYLEWKTATPQRTSGANSTLFVRNIPISDMLRCAVTKKNLVKCVHRTDGYSTEAGRGALWGSSTVVSSVSEGRAGDSGGKLRRKEKVLSSHLERGPGWDWGGPSGSRRAI